MSPIELCSIFELQVRYKILIQQSCQETTKIRFLHTWYEGTKVRRHHHIFGITFNCKTPLLLCISKEFFDIEEASFSRSNTSVINAGNLVLAFHLGIRLFWYESRIGNSFDHIHRRSARTQNCANMIFTVVYIICMMR